MLGTFWAHPLFLPRCPEPHFRHGFLLRAFGHQSLPMSFTL
jgi:hypothetical protein